MLLMRSSHYSCPVDPQWQKDIEHERRQARLDTQTVDGRELAMRETLRAANAPSATLNATAGTTPPRTADTNAEPRVGVLRHEPSGASQVPVEAPPSDDEERQAEPPEKSWIVQFDENDPDDPRNMSKARKWLITFMVAFSSICVTVNSSIYTFTYGQLEREFGVSEEICTLGLTFFVVGVGRPYAV